MKKILQLIKQRSITRKLLVSFLSILIIPVAIVAAIAYESASSSLDRQMMGSALENVQQLNDIINTSIGEKENSAEYFSEWLTQKKYKAKSNASIEEKFSQYIKINKDVESIYTSDKDGRFTRYPDLPMPSDYNPVERDWYKKAVANNGKVVITDPYKTASTNTMVVTIAQQTKDGSGVIAINMTIDNLLKTTKQVNIGTEGYAFIMTKDKKVVAHPDETSGTELKGDWLEQMLSADKGDFQYSMNGDKKKMAFDTNKLTGWKIGGTMYLDEIHDAAKPVLHLALIVLIAAILVGIIVMTLVIRSITTPLKQLVGSSKRISEGDLTETIDIRSKDELGELGKSFNNMASSLRSLIHAIQDSVDNVAASSEELTASAAQTSKATEHITLAIEQFSNGNEKQNENIETAAEHIYQMNDGLTNMAQASEVITDSSVQSTEIASAGGQLVHQTVGQMNVIDKSVKEAEQVVRGLETKSKDITNILRVINGIADQTNLLALNAAIEAARAGEYGRGFSVVAEEVRKLAVQSADSAKEIEALIIEIVKEINTSLGMFQSVNQEVQTGLDITDQTETSFKRISEMTNQIAGELQNMSATVQQLSASSEEVSGASEHIASISKESSAHIQDIAASAEQQLASMEEISSSAETLSSMAEELRDMTKRFKIE
ncbi:methyl-accepting chemotaxis protein [Bacillus halotolerans]|uniref:Methyl-accepting chemotaxis protein n=2 Tax=Bacillus halotolerans TaxID=260554 RepID=A0ABY7HYD4_9BACI|nr:methyl-accepting chemotaxis protein [Bacillus halotolerans]KUP35848.1 chemotaxis protein [Bacillus halotolerans]MCR6596327.1 methyl-accepting chemotaxis protein [Bacillus halotolerans]MDG0765186.1 methyl-accepting chemotaxis protein [Bacillus halotolerans]MEC1404921.1 methyl-accepting chemotaxis protein [Bacillus halotolerans]UUI83464.1 methyl-accepting chemotaxis protein [Bacillus halotolerans]